MVFDGLIEPASLEAHACSEALALARDLNLQNLVIASDCLEVISNINNKASPVYAPILREILVSSNIFITFSFPGLWAPRVIESRP